MKKPMNNEIIETLKNRKLKENQMRISDMAVGEKVYTQLASTALAVLVRHVDSWCVYISGVPGLNHHRESAYAIVYGDKAKEEIAIAIAKHLFYPSFEIDLPYAN